MTQWQEIASHGERYSQAGREPCPTSCKEAGRGFRAKGIICIRNPDDSGRMPSHGRWLDTYDGPVIFDCLVGKKKHENVSMNPSVRPIKPTTTSLAGAEYEAGVIDGQRIVLGRKPRNGTSNTHAAAARCRHWKIHLIRDNVHWSALNIKKVRTS